MPIQPVQARPKAGLFYLISKPNALRIWNKTTFRTGRKKICLILKKLPFLGFDRHMNADIKSKKSNGFF